MDYDIASLIIGNEINKSVNSTNQESFSEIIKDRGIESAIVSYRPFKFGTAVPEDPSQVFRKFFYNQDGRVIKKFDFDTNGNIVSKEESDYDKVDKWKIIQKNIITAEDSFIENYEYTRVNAKQKLKKYSFLNPRWPRPKTEIYEYDDSGRIAQKTSYGLLGDPELFTQYLYETEKDTKVTYRYVTLPGGELVITLLYTYDNKKQKQTGLYSFMKLPEEITELRNSGKKNWELESISRSIWEYDANGNNTVFYRDEKYSSALDMLINPEETFLPETSRIMTEKSTRVHEKIHNKYYLVKETEWNTRINEPLKAVKNFKYLDKDDNVINSALPQ